MARWLIDYDNKTTGSSGFEFVNAESDCTAQTVADYFRDWYAGTDEEVEIRGIFKEIKNWR